MNRLHPPIAILVTLPLLFGCVRGGVSPTGDTVGSAQQGEVVVGGRCREK